MMRNGSLSIALIAALLTAGASGVAYAQQQTQPVPEAPQPQQKKTPPDKPAANQTSPPASQPASTKDENPFPEATSQDAAKAAQTGDSKKPTAVDNPFPEAVSKDAAKAAQTDDSKKTPQLENPFPESQSRDAAKAAGNDPEPTPAPKHNLPPGVSSSSDSGDLSGGDAVVDPARAKKDANVGSFYLNSGNYKGALQRYKDATAADPSNVDAIFGLAEAQRMLKNNTEAAKNYQLYLDIVPNGPKSKEALKALKALPAGQ
jgi:tetratricopeptide (TPR) repeat protein